MNEEKKMQPIKAGLFDATPKAKPLDNVPCSLVLLSNLSSTNDVVNAPGNAPIPDSANQEIYWGVNGFCANPLNPSSVSILIPVANLNQLFVRCSTDNTEGKRLYYTCFDEI